MKVFHLKFNKETDGDWYFDFLGEVYLPDTLKMARGSDLLCEYLAEKEGHPDYAIIDVTFYDNLIAERVPDIVLTLLGKDDDGYVYHSLISDGTPPIINRDCHTIEIAEACLISILFYECDHLLPGKPFIQYNNGPRFYITQHTQPRRINIYIKH